MLKSKPGLAPGFFFVSLALGRCLRGGKTDDGTYSEMESRIGAA
jgi:hypothetical protein